MDAGLPRVEFEAHGRIASAVAKTRENRAPSDQKQRNSAFQAQFHRPGRLKSDRLLERELEIVDNFTAYLKSCMNDKVCEQFERIAQMRDLGLNSENGRIGVLFPGHFVDFLPVFSKHGEVDT